MLDGAFIEESKGVNVTNGIYSGYEKEEQQITANFGSTIGAQN